MMYLLVFTASFFQVFLLGFNSKVLRDDKIWTGFCVSWTITMSNYAFIWSVTEAGLSAGQFIFTAGLGGSIGITSAQFFYKWYDNRFHGGKGYVKKECGNVHPSDHTIDGMCECSIRTPRK